MKSNPFTYQSMEPHSALRAWKLGFIGDALSALGGVAPPTFKPSKWKTFFSFSG